MPNEHIQKVKNEAWMFYTDWRNHTTFSPAFNENIIISRKGWNHITGISGRKRKWNDVYRRLKLLPYAKDLIEKSTTIQNIKVKKGITYFAIEGVMEISINSKNIFTKVRVILIEDKQKRKIFYSVMSKSS